MKVKKLTKSKKGSDSMEEVGLDEGFEIEGKMMQ